MLFKPFNSAYDRKTKPVVLFCLPTRKFYNNFCVLTTTE